MLTEPPSLPEAPGEHLSPVSSGFQKLPAFFGSWLLPPPSKHQCYLSLCLSPIVALPSDCNGQVLASKDACDYAGPAQIIQEDLPISRSFTTSAKTLSPCKVTYSQVLGMRTWALFWEREALFCLPREYHTGIGIQPSLEAQPSRGVIMVHESRGDYGA